VTDSKKQVDLHSTRDIASLFAAIQKINHRLDKLESPVSTSATSALAHPSQEKFSIPEAIADGIFDGIQKERACTFEPNGKPCDHCLMCSCRGF